MPARTIELPFPFGGVNRRSSNRRHSDQDTPTAVWATNVRTEGVLSRRLRGGSRPGLSQFVWKNYGSIADMVSVQTSSGELLVVLADSTLNVTQGETNSTPVAYLLTSGGDRLITSTGDFIVASTATVPSSGFLVVGNQKAYAITSSSIVEMNPDSGEVNSLTPTVGTVPTGTFGAIYRDRLLVAGSDNAIFASRQGDYSSWDVGANWDDDGRAAVFQLSLAGKVGDTVTALIPHKDGLLLCATKRSLWVLEGDPVTGRLSRVSENTGIVSPNAWIKTDDTISFLAEDGLYRCGPDGSNLTPLSTQAIPEELRGIDTDTVSVSMGYDHERLAFHIYLRTNDGNDTHWLFERQSQAFWPMRIPDRMSPVVTTQHAGMLLLAGGDGIIRKLEGSDDDGTAIESHVLIGPFKMGSLDRYGLANSLHGILGQGGGSVDWHLIAGDDADTVAANGKAAIEAFQAGASYSQYVDASGTWTAGRSTTARPRVRGMYGCFWLQSSSSWAMEGLTLEVSAAGKWR